MARSPVPLRTPLVQVPQAQPAEPRTRVPMVVKLESRDGLLTEGLITNGFVEMKKGQLSTFLRPGLAIDYAAGLTAGQGVLVGADELFVVGDATLKFKPNKLTFTVQPSDVAPDTSISPAVKVALQNSAGATLTYATDVIILSFESTPGSSAVLSGTLAVAAIAGVATFSDLSIDDAGVGYTLEAGIRVPTLDTFVTLSGPRKTSTSFDVVLSDLVAVQISPGIFGFVDPSIAAGFGSITPATLGGANILDVEVNTSSGQLQVGLQGHLGVGFFTSITINGTTKNVADRASYLETTLNGVLVSLWFWGAPLPYTAAGTYPWSYV